MVAQRATTSMSCRTWRRQRSTRGSVRFAKWAANCCKGFGPGIHHLRVGVPFSRSIIRLPLDVVNPGHEQWDAVLMRLPCVITQPTSAPTSVVNRYASRIRRDGSRTTTTLTGRSPSTLGHTASYVTAFNERLLPYATTPTACHSHDPAALRLRAALAAASFGLGKRGPFF